MTTTEKPTAPSDIPSFDIDLHTDENLADPLPIYARLRDAGPVVWLDHYGYYALPRWAEADAALNDWDTFTSAEGVGFNEYFNAIRTTSLMTHGAHHDEIKNVESQPIMPKCIKDLRPKLREFAENLAKDLQGRGQIDGVADLAMRMPIDVVTELIGLDVDRTQLYQWGVAGFDSIGPLHASRTGPALQTMAGYFEYADKNIPSTVRAGGWAEQLFENGRAKGWSEDFCRGVMNDYVYPALDTTINAMSMGVLLFSQNPDQWDKLRADRELLNQAAHEIVRLATPIQYFTRVTTRDVETGGTTIPAGSRVLIMFASANRDERQFDRPDEFDITRPVEQHMGWGRGKHQCMGKPLARMEITSLFDVLADHVEHFEVGNYTWHLNNCVRGIGTMELTLR